MTSRLSRLPRAVARRLGSPARPAVRPGPAQPVGARPLTADEQAIVDAFHRLYYEPWQGTQRSLNVNWLGYRATKCPFDAWTYQEILVETRPQVVIESGTRLGGTSVFLASIFDLLGGEGRVVTIDVNADPRLPKHPRIEYLTGSSLDGAIVDRVRAAAAGKRTMVILDSLHTAEHVGAELALYADLVSIGCYLIVEDGNVNGHPVLPDYGPGPTEAVEAFVATTDAFVVDRDRERFMVTLNPGGYLRRVR
ncbi:MAG TPA: CmcI family methyltransferase [Candidatus Limnocylindrales bacterium]|nr:CmcI family methyltransferase [Candidatus Limnocylindrales bacterium]